MPVCDLIAPQSYWDATAEEIAAVVNGCGPGGWRLDLVPDDLLGLDITEACNIHDWMYGEGFIKRDKSEADRTLLCNLLRLIDVTADDNGPWALYAARREAAWIYYKAVADWGYGAYWDGKPGPRPLTEGT